MQQSSLPSLGLGTYNVTNKETIKAAILDLDYKLLDCASFYKNEEMIGEALSELFSQHSLKRSDLFIISKVWFDEIEDIEAAIKRSLQKLKLE